MRNLFRGPREASSMTTWIGLPTQTPGREKRRGEERRGEEKRGEENKGVFLQAIAATYVVQGAVVATIYNPYLIWYPLAIFFALLVCVLSWQCVTDTTALISNKLKAPNLTPEPQDTNCITMGLQLPSLMSWWNTYTATIMPFQFHLLMSSPCSMGLAIL